MKYFLISMISAFFGMLVLNYVQDAKGMGNDAINKLKLQNDSLLQANLKLDSANDVLNAKIEQESIAIENLTLKDDIIKSKVNEMDTKIKSLNIKYEKATNHANNFGSYEITSYFANL